MRYDKQRRTVGDIVEAGRLFESIARTLWRERLQDRELRFVIEGTQNLLTQAQAEAWVKESAHLGFTEVRFLVAADERGSVVIELSASSPIVRTEQD